MGQITLHTTLRRRLTLTALLVGLGVAVVGCSSGSAPPAVSLRTPNGAISGTAASDGATSTSAAPPGAGAPSAAAEAAASTPAAATNHPVATTAPAQPVGTTAATRPATPTAPPTPASTGPAPAAPGTYTYAGSGSTTLTSNGKVTTLAASPQSTLVVSAGSNGSEQWNNASTIVSNLVFNNSGVFLTSETVSFAGGSTTCTFASPVPMPPWPVAVGKSFSGQATCGSGSSAGTFSLVGQVSAGKAVPVGGATVSTFQVHSTLTMSGLSVDETDLYAPSLRLPVASSIVINGSLGSSSIVSSAAYALSSLP
jgi:hypothetical protein